MLLIPHPEHLQDTVQRIAIAGKEHFHVVADFDRTLTRAFVDGKPRSSLESILESKELLGHAYSEQSKKNFDTYYPIEIDPNVPLEKKKATMIERRTVQFKLMLDTGLTKDIIKETMQSEQIAFRDNYQNFFSLLQAAGIPLLIFSASGLGYEGIYHALESNHILTDNVHIIANAFERDAHGRAIAVKEPIIHSFNKGEIMVHNLPVFETIKEKKNILLLGDSPGDTHMADGFDYENIIKIGFLNKDTPENRKLFQEKFDLVILDDGPMDEVNEILKKIIS